MRFSENGSLIYDPGTAANQEYSLVWVDRSGATQLVTELRRDYEEPQFSPDGSRLLSQFGKVEIVTSGSSISTAEY